MRRSLQWFVRSPSRLSREQKLLGSLPYFLAVSSMLAADSGLVVVGILSCVGVRSGKTEQFRVRLQYPRDFPDHVPSVFDHVHRFQPSLDGHQFPNHRLCLTLPDRKEFSTGTEHLTEEVLGASLLWFRKRLLYERGFGWPGPVERHGIWATFDLVAERLGLTDACPISIWMQEHAATPSGKIIEPDVYAACPCGSGKRARFCHPDELKLLANCSRAYSSLASFKENHAK